jgi:protochlorophyllide reductase
MSDRPAVLITGASSGVGLHALPPLAQRGWDLVLACRDLPKARREVAEIGVDPDACRFVELDLGSMASVRACAEEVLETEPRLDAMVCNAAVYLPRLKAPRRSPEGFEISVATNHLGHFLLTLLLLPRLAESVEGRAEPPRHVTVGTVTANSEEFGGRVPIPAPADLGDLSGLEGGFQAPLAMIDGGPFKPGKAYKDSKLCTMITTLELHRRHHERTGVVFSSLYPGCVADTALFREAPALFRRIFPWFQRTITGGYVSQWAAGERVADVVTRPDLARSGVHWSWGNRQREGRDAFVQKLSPRATDPEVGRRLWEASLDLVGEARAEAARS